MSHHSGVLVTFDKSLHEEDVAALMQAIRQIRSVISVEPAPPDGVEIAMAKSQVRREMLMKVVDMIKDMP